MADTWITDIAHFLDENGEMIKEPPQARKLGEYLAAIIVMASYILPRPGISVRVQGSVSKEAEAKALSD